MIWQFSFDLKIDNLKQHYNKAPSSAYKEIEKYLVRNGFNNRTEKQGSCYFTSNHMTYYQVNAIIRQMFNALPWLPYCVSKAAIAEKPQANYNYIPYVTRMKRTQKCKQALDDYKNCATPQNAVKPSAGTLGVATTTSDSSDKSKEGAALNFSESKPKKKKSKSR